jgi:hypothetical protein
MSALRPYGNIYRSFTGTHPVRERHLNAKEFLQNRLARGPAAVAVLLDEGKQHGISEDELKRAKLGLPIRDSRDQGRWVWHLEREL